MAHTHDVYDTDPYFVIDADTRTITDQSTIPTSLMQYDHNSERITFEIPKEIDGHDMSLCDRIEIHYLNIGTNGQKSEDVYEVDDAIVDSGEQEVVLFTWLVSQNATIHAGSLSFVIRFICSSDGNLDYVWNTAIYNSIPVGKGMDNAALIITQYADVLQAWYDELVGKIDNIADKTLLKLKDVTVTTIDETSTHDQYPTAKAVYDLFDAYCQQVNTLLESISSGEATE